MAHCLETMAVWIADERPVVVGVILRSKPGRAVIAPARHQSRGVERAHRRPIRREEAQMGAGSRSSQLGLAGYGELDAERSRRRAVIRAAAIAEVDDPHKPKWTQCGVIETSAAPDIANSQGNMIQHGPSPLER
jgi:hypothetical protein